MNTQLVAIVRQAPSTILRNVGISNDALTIVPSFCVGGSTSVVGPEDNGPVITLTTIEEGDVIHTVAIRISAKAVVTSELNDFSAITECTLGRSSFSSYTNCGQSNESRECK